MLLVVLALARWPDIERIVAGRDDESSGSRWKPLAAPALLLLAVVATRSAGVALVLAFAAAIVLSRRTLRDVAPRLTAAALLTGPALFFVLGWGR